MDGISSSDILLLTVDDSSHLSSVKTQYDLTFLKKNLADIAVRTNATWGLARITQAEKLREQNARLARCLTFVASSLNGT